MFEGIVPHEVGALGPFACTRATEHEDDESGVVASAGREEGGGSFWGDEGRVILVDGWHDGGAD